jgi:hypothetical protein
MEYKDALLHGYTPPDPDDVNDPGYHIKYPHTMPPLIAYMNRPHDY